MTGPRPRRDRSGKDPRATGESIAVAAGLLGVVLLFVAGTLVLDRSARVVPGSILVPLSLLTGYALWSELRSRKREMTAVAPVVPRLELGLFAWIILLPALVEAAGLTAGGFLFVTLWLWRRGRERLPFAIGAGMATAVALWLLTTTILQGIPVGGRLMDLIVAGR